MADRERKPRNTHRGPPQPHPHNGFEADLAAFEALWASPTGGQAVVQFQGEAAAAEQYKRHRDDATFCYAVAEDLVARLAHMQERARGPGGGSHALVNQVAELVARDLIAWRHTGHPDYYGHTRRANGRSYPADTLSKEAGDADPTG